MSILTSIFSSGASELIKGVGGVIDSLHTSDEEKLAAEQKVKDFGLVYRPLKKLSCLGGINVNAMYVAVFVSIRSAKVRHP